jgi:hypothetical protein
MALGSRAATGCPAATAASAPAHLEERQQRLGGCRWLLQVLNKQFEVVTHLAGCAAFGKRDAAAALGGLVDKIHELKHK